jgi:hypothetical protein
MNPRVAGWWSPAENSGVKIRAIGHGGLDCTDNLRCWAVAPPGARLDSISTTQTESQVQKLVTAMLILAAISHLLPRPGSR